MTGSPRPRTPVPTAATTPPDPTSTCPATPARRGVTRAQLLRAARLGAAVARADLAGRPADAAPAYASWRRLRRRLPREPRQLLRVAFDTGYGRAVHASGALPTR